MKRCLMPLVIRDRQVKTSITNYFKSSHCQNFKSDQILCTASGSINWDYHFGKQFAILTKVEELYSWFYKIYFKEYILKKFLLRLLGDMFKNVSRDLFVTSKYEE